MKIKTFLLFALLVLLPSVAFAGTATVTNNGNFPVRVQYKTPAGTYEDIGHLEPGQTANVPGGVEKVKIVRNLGEWAKPLDSGQVLEVEVKVDGESKGTMTWYGDKVFFDGLTAGPPPAAAVQAEPPPATDWPWMGGAWNFLFPFMMILMWLPLFYLWIRQWGRTRYYLGNKWVGQEKLGWGWGWSQGNTCGWLGILIGLLVGLAFGGIGIWGYWSYAAIGDYGLLGILARDFYSVPNLFFGELGLLGWGPMPLMILTFWVLLATGCGLAGGLMPMKWLYAMPFLISFAPAFLLMRGCAGPNPFALDGGYGSVGYPAALTSSYAVCMIADYLLDLVDPYYLMDEDEEEDVHWAVYDFFRGNPVPLLVFLAGGCVTCFYDYAYDLGMTSAIGEAVNRFPMMFFGALSLPYQILPMLFWMILFGGMGWTLFRNPSRGLFYLTMIPALLIFLFMMMGSYPQRDLRGIYPNRINLSGRIRPDLLRALGQSMGRDADRFADDLGTGQFGEGAPVGRDLLFGEPNQIQIEQDRWE